MLEQSRIRYSLIQVAIPQISIQCAESSDKAVDVQIAVRIKIKCEGEAPILPEYTQYFVSGFNVDAWETHSVNIGNIVFKYGLSSGHTPFDYTAEADCSGVQPKFCGVISFDY